MEKKIIIFADALSELSEQLKSIPKDDFAFARSEEKIMDAQVENKSLGFFKDAFIRLRKNKLAIISFWVLCFIIVMAIVGPDMNEYTFSQQFTDYTYMPPRVPVLEDYGIFDGARVLTNRRLDSLEDPEKFPNDCVIGWSNPHDVRGVTLVDVEVNYYKYVGAEEHYFWFGTDALGRDVWTRLWRGARVSLIVAAVSTLSDVVIGVIYGSIAGFFGGKVDLLMMRFCEILAAFPNIVICTLLIMVMGSGMTAMILALCIKGWVGSARIVRTQFLRHRNREYVMAARTMGVPDRGLIFRHILPNAIGPLITNTMVNLPNAIFTESFLAYMGLGIAPPMASIGNMMADGRAVLLQYPYMMLYPALLMSVLMLSFQLLGQGLRVALNPTLRGVE